MYPKSAHHHNYYHDCEFGTSNGMLVLVLSKLCRCFSSCFMGYSDVYLLQDQRGYTWRTTVRSAAGRRRISSSAQPLISCAQIYTKPGAVVITYQLLDCPLRSEANLLLGMPGVNQGRLFNLNILSLLTLHNCVQLYLISRQSCSVCRMSSLYLYLNLYSQYPEPKSLLPYRGLIMLSVLSCRLAFTTFLVPCLCFFLVTQELYQVISGIQVI